MRWRLKLEEYDYHIEYKPGKVNSNADALSRIRINKTTVLSPAIPENEDNDLKDNCEQSTPEENKSDDNSPPGSGRIRIKLFKDRRGNYRHWIKDIDKQKQLMKEYHDNPTGGHQGLRRTLSAIRLKYYWPNLKKDIKEYIKTCISCNERRSSPNEVAKAPMQITDTPNKVFEIVHMDITGPLPTTDKNNKYLLTFQDAFTKYPEAIPIPDQSAKTIAEKFITDIICKHGTPSKLITDQGTNFLSELFKEICQLLNIKKIQTTAYHPQSNGIVERSHRTLMNYLSHYVNKEQTDWDTWVPFALFAYRSTPHSTTGFSPFLMVHGREPELPSELKFNEERSIPVNYSKDDYVEDVARRLTAVFQLARENIIKRKDKSKTYYDKKSLLKSFSPDELILVHDDTVKRGRFKKLKRPWIGPYKVLDKLSDVNYLIKKGRYSVVIHINRLNPFRLRSIT